MKKIRVVILSGPSGAGKSTAIKVLEDIGFFCVDNLPVTLLPKFLELLDQSGEISKVATVVDVREREFLRDFPRIFENLKKGGYRAELIYLEASDEAILRRFSETRRRHPLAVKESPVEGIVQEREILKDVKTLADRIIDTTNFNVHQLREVIKEVFTGPVSLEKIVVNIISFGYRYGIPADADLVFDVRFLPNPYFVDSLKGFNGLDQKVREFVLARKETIEFVDRLKGFIDYLIPFYWKEGKSYLTVAIGCTGGKHRSVVVAEYLTEVLKHDVAILRKRHRDIEKP